MLPRDLDFLIRFDISKDVSFNEKKKKMTLFFRWPKNSNQSLRTCYIYLQPYHFYKEVLIRCQVDGHDQKEVAQKNFTSIGPFLTEL